MRKRGRYTNGLKSRENRERKGGDLDRTPDDVRYNEHQHTQLQLSE